MKKKHIIIFVVFLLLALLVGSNHEHWADEAQSWIIARDASALEIIWDIARYEGSFPLWHLTLRLFIKLGLNYEHFYVVPIIISSIGLIVFLKKVEAPKYVKILLPFSYYVFYQYTIVARSYCYLLLAFSLLMATYKKRFENPLKYILSLIFMSFISMHGMVIAFTLSITFFVEVLKSKNVRKYVKEFIIFGIIIIGEIIILFPRSDLYMTVAATYTIPEIIRSIINIEIGNGNIFCKLYNIINITLILILFIRICLLKNKDIAIATGMLFLFMFIIRFVEHHSGIIFYLVMFGMICNYAEIKEKAKYIDKIFIVVLVLYNILSIQAGTNDYFEKYSGAEEMATYIKEKGYDEKEIFGFGYKDVSLQPYFEKNLYKNMNEAIYRWTINNEDFYTYCNFEKCDKSDFTEVPEYIVLEWDESDSKIKLIESYIEESNKYEIEYRTTGCVFFKNSHSENEGYTLYRLKNQ